MSQESPYPIRLEADYPERSSRGLALLGILCMFPKVLLLIPHLFILSFVNFAALIAVYFSYWIILFTGRYPRAMYDFAKGILQWQTRTSAWLFGLTDQYPPFSLQ